MYGLCFDKGGCERTPCTPLPTGLKWVPALAYKCPLTFTGCEYSNLTGEITRALKWDSLRDVSACGGSTVIIKSKLSFDVSLSNYLLYIKWDIRYLPLMYEYFLHLEEKSSPVAMLWIHIIWSIELLCPADLWNPFNYPRRMESNL